MYAIFHQLFGCCRRKEYKVEVAFEEFWAYFKKQHQQHMYSLGNLEVNIFNLRLFGFLPSCDKVVSALQMETGAGLIPNKMPLVSICHCMLQGTQKV